MSPALTRTEIIATSGAPPEAVESLYRDNKCLEPDNVALAVEYALAAPATVNVTNYLKHLWNYQS